MGKLVFFNYNSEVYGDSDIGSWCFGKHKHVCYFLRKKSKKTHLLDLFSSIGRIGTLHEFYFLFSSVHKYDIRIAKITSIM